MRGRGGVRKRGRADGEDIFFFFEEDCHHYCCCYITVWEEQQQRNLAKEAADRACAEGSPQEHIPPSCQDSPPRGIGNQMAPPPPERRPTLADSPHTQRRDSLPTTKISAHISRNNPMFSHMIQYNTIPCGEASNHVSFFPTPTTSSLNGCMEVKAPHCIVFLLWLPSRVHPL